MDRQEVHSQKADRDNSRKFKKWKSGLLHPQEMKLYT